MPRQPCCSVVVFGCYLVSRLVRSWSAGVGSPASPGEAQLPRMVAVRDILLDALSWSKSSLREKVSIHMVKKAISELLGLMVYM